MSKEFFMAKVTEKIKSQWAESIIEGLVDQNISKITESLEEELEYMNERIAFIRKMLKKIKKDVKVETISSEAPVEQVVESKYE
jgi:hypothetical protein